MWLGWYLVISIYVGFEYWWVYLCVQGCISMFFGGVSNNIWQFRLFGDVIAFVLHVFGV